MERGIEDARGRQRSGEVAGSSVGSSGGEGRPTPRVLKYNDTLRRVLLPAYTDIASRMTSLGLGSVSVAEAEEQVTPMGVSSSDSSPFVVVTFEGTEIDLQSFRDVAYGVDAILNPITGKRPFRGNVERQAVEKAIRERLESLAARKRIQESTLASLRNPRPDK